MANNCSAQKKVTDVFYGSDIRPINTEYLIPSNLVQKTEKYIRDVQNFASNKYKLGSESPLMSVVPAEMPGNKGYKKVHFFSNNFSKLEVLMGQQGESEQFTKAAMKDYNKIQEQVKKDQAILEQARLDEIERDGYEAAYQDVLRTLTEETAAYLAEQEEAGEEMSYSKRSTKETAERLLKTESDTKDKSDIKNGFLEMRNYRRNLIDKSKSTLHALALEIKKTVNNPTRKQELLDSYESLRDYTYGNTQKGISGIEAQQVEIEEQVKDYKALQNTRDEIIKELHFHTQSGDLAGIALEEKNLLDIDNKIQESKFEDMTSMLHGFVHIDLNRAKVLVKTGKLEDLKEALNIINYYKALDPDNTQNINPFFSTTELNSGKISESSMNYLREFAAIARQTEDEVYNGAKDAILSYINSLNYFTEIRDGETYTTEEVFKIANGLPDISILDSYMGNISDNPYSKEQSLLLSAIHKQLEDRISGEQAAIKAIEDKLDSQQEVTSDELIRLGHTVENSPSAPKSNFITDKLAIFHRNKNKASFTYFKQVSKNGVLKNRLVQQASSSYEGYMKEAQRLFSDRVEAIREGKSKLNYDEVLSQYHNKIRASSHVIKPHLIAEIALDQDYSSFLGSGVKYSADQQAEMEAYRAMLIDEIGQRGYDNLVEDQKRLMEDFILTNENNRKKALEDYRVLMDDDTIEFDDIQDVSIIDDLENWELDNNPFNLGFLFEENKKFKITRTDPGRSNHFSNYGSRGEKIDYNSIIPRKNKVTISTPSADTIPFAFKKIELTDTGQDSGYLDPKFREIQDNDILNDYWETIMEASDYYEQTLEPRDRASWERGTIPLDKNVKIKRFTKEANSTRDAILSFLSKPFRALLQKYGESIASNQELAIDFSEVDMTTNQAIKKINSGSLNVANRAIYKEIMTLRAIELYAHYKDQGKSIKEKELTRDRTFPVAGLPQSMLKEALLLTGNYSEKIIKSMTPTTVISEFKDKFDIPTVVNKKGVTVSNINILGLLEDLHIQNNLLQSEEDLGLIMRKNMAEAGVIQARRKAQDLIEFMAEFYENIGNAGTTNEGKIINLFRNSGATKILGDRTNAKRELKNFMDKILYLGGDVQNSTRVLKGDERPNSNQDFFTRTILGKKDKMDLINSMLANPDITEKQRTRLESLRVSETKYIDATKMFARPVLGGARFFFLAVKVLTHVNNLIQGQRAIIQMDGTGTYWEPGKIFKAQQVMQQSVVRSLAGTTRLTPDGNKARFILDRLQIVEDASTLEAKALHRNQTANYLKNLLAPYSGVKRVEYINQGSVAVALLMSEKITDNTGKESNVWEAMDSKGKLKDNFRYLANGQENTTLINTWEKFNSQEYFDFRSKMKEARNKTAGNYDFETSSVANNNEAGKLVLGLKRWMYELFGVFYSNERVSFAAGKVIKGRTTSFTPEELLAQRLMGGVPGTGFVSGMLFAAPLYLFDFLRHQNSADINSFGKDISGRPQRTWSEMSNRMGMTFKIGLKTAVGLPLNLVTNLAGINPLVDMSTDTVFGKNDLSKKLAELGINDTDLGNINAMGRSLGMQMITMGVMLSMYILLQSDFDDDDEEEEKEAIKEKRKKGEIVVTRKDLVTMAYNIAQTGYKDGMTYMMNARDMYDTATSVATMEWFTKLDDFSKLVDKRILGLEEDTGQTGASAGKSKTWNAVMKFAPIPGRDLKSSSKRIYEEPVLFQTLTMDMPLRAEKDFKSLRLKTRADYRKTVIDLTEDQISNLYEDNGWKFTPSTDEKPRKLSNVQKSYLDRVMKELIPNPTVDNVDYKEVKKDAKAVITGDMTAEQYKEKYIKEEE